MELKKGECEKKQILRFDPVSKDTFSTAEQTPLVINYSYAGKRYEKEPDADDLALLQKIEEMDTTAIIFFLKTQGGWAEKKISDVNLSANGSAPEGLLSIYKRMKEDA